MKEVAARHGIQPQQLTAWRRLVRKGQLAIPAERETEFAALVIEPPVGEAPVPAPLVGVVEVAVGDVVVRLSGDAPVERIAAIARALRP